MKAIILAGGKGTRLRPYTSVFPKPLMPLGDDNAMPILEVVVRQLARFGFDEITMITGYLSELLESFFGDGRKFGVAIDYVREERPLGTAGGLALLEKPGDSVLVMNGDILTTLDYRAMFDFHVQRDAIATIAAYPREVKIDFGVLDFGPDPSILAGYREKPKFEFNVSMGVYLLAPEAWDRIPPGQDLTMPELLETLRGEGHDIHCFRQDCYWLDIGRHDDYESANAIFEQRRHEFLGAPIPAGQGPHLFRAREGVRPHVGHHER